MLDVKKIYNFNCIDFNTLFNDQIYIEILNTWNTYKLIDNYTINLRNKDVKNVLTYFTLFYTSKLLTQTDLNKNVIIIQPYTIILKDKTVTLNETSFINNIKNTLKVLKQKYTTQVIFLKKVADLNDQDVLTYLNTKVNVFVV